MAMFDSCVSLPEGMGQDYGDILFSFHKKKKIANIPLYRNNIIIS